jgi:hypothetical protein
MPDFRLFIREGVRFSIDVCRISENTANGHPKTS